MGSMTILPMISLSIKHADAIHIVRSLAKMFNQHVTSECMTYANEESEEGEIPDNRIEIRVPYSGTRLFDKCVYDSVCMNPPECAS